MIDFLTRVLNVIGEIFYKPRAIIFNGVLQIVEVSRMRTAKNSYFRIKAARVYLQRFAFARKAKRAGKIQLFYTCVGKIIIGCVKVSTFFNGTLQSPFPTL